MIGTRLDRYRILEKLGTGGQGTVYKAIDVKLGRTVAVKVLPEQLAVQGKNLKYFEREARLASALDHPGICTIFDLHELEGIYFISMEYIEGKNIRELVNGRPLALSTVLGIGIQVTDALAAAHERGIIHRDIKAGNVMVRPSGHAKVLDFGLAKLLDNERDGNESHSETTELGRPYGTAAYAAPEQSQGERVDERADIFSTGVLLYEMLTGVWPFRGKTAVAIRQAVCYNIPLPLAEVRRDAIPPRLQQLVDRALAKKKEDRYQKIGDLQADLHQVMRQVSTGSNLEQPNLNIPVEYLTGNILRRRVLSWLRGLAGDKTSQQGRTSTKEVSDTDVTRVDQDQRKSVAILPFKNLSNDAASSFYEFSLPDAVITELARVRSLVVRPSSMIVKYQGQQIDPQEVGRELGVGAVLTAAFIRAGGRLRVTAQLLDVASGEILWSDRIDTSAEDIINVQDNIVRAIVDGLRIELTPDEQVELGKPATEDAASYEEYLRGRDVLARFIYHTGAREDVDAAIDRFQRTVELDPKFALAHSALGTAYINRTQKNLGEAGDYDKAEAAFEQALALDPKLLEARLHLVFIYMARLEKQKARDTVDQLRTEYPNEVGVYYVRGLLARLDGNYDVALRSFDRMVSLNPAERVVASYNRARIFMYQQRWEEAQAELDLGAAVEPGHPLIKIFRARVEYYRGELNAATDLFEEVLLQHPQMHGIRPLLGICLAAQGKVQAAFEQLSGQVEEIAGRDSDIAYWLASAYAVLEQKDKAHQWLAVTIDLGNENYRWFASDPNWRAFHNEPRFKELVTSKAQ